MYTAEFQTGGRGRLDHRWLAPRGVNLTFSAVFDVSGLAPQEIVTFPLVVGLALIDAVRTDVPPVAPPLALKWPNDVLSGARKLAGILCERVGEHVIAGIGLNVNEVEFAPEIAARATSLASLAGHAFDRVRLRARVLDTLYAAHARWRRDGFAAFAPACAAVDALAGRTVTVCQTDHDPAPVTGYCAGIQRDGTLLVGTTRIYAGEAHVLI